MTNIQLHVAALALSVITTMAHGATWQRIGSQPTSTLTWSKICSNNKSGAWNSVKACFDVSQITKGVNHSCALTTAGAVYCWGSNYTGQLGDNNWPYEKAYPVLVTGMSSGVTAISAGDEHTCAVKAGYVYCWGYNLKGQLGDNFVNADDIDFSPVPKQIYGLSNNISQVVSAGTRTCVVTTGSAVSCWGAGSAVPSAAVGGLSGGVASLAVGEDFNCALMTNGGVKCWGDNLFGQLGTGDNTSRASAADVAGLTYGVRQIAAGYRHACAITTTNVILCWGSNGNSQLGTFTQNSANNYVYTHYGNTTHQRLIFASRDTTCAVDSAGVASCWGDNSQGLLGNKSYTSSVWPVTINGISGAVNQIAIGYFDVCAKTEDNSAACWGSTKGTNYNPTPTTVPSPQ